MDEILKSLSSKRSRWGVSSAAAYVQHFKHLDNFETILKEAEGRLTYCNDAMRVKAAYDPKEVSESAICVFDAVLTTTRRDRDGDILESSGGVLDQKMPLLWQHLQQQPIGRFVKEISRQKKYIAGRMAIADVPLGRDAAKLVEMDALRISHGFQPLDYSPIYDEEDTRDGWHFKRWEMMEVSLVSMPSNVEAVVTDVHKMKQWEKQVDGLLTLYGKGKFETDLVKEFGKKWWEARPVLGKGADFIDPEPEEPIVKEVPVDEKAPDEKPADEEDDTEEDDDEDTDVVEDQDDEKSMCGKGMKCLKRAMTYDMSEKARANCVKSYDCMAMLETKLCNHDQSMKRGFLAELAKNVGLRSEVSRFIKSLDDADHAMEVARKLGVIVGR